LEPGGGEQERERRAADDDDGAAQRQLQAPAVADLPDDVDELRAMARIPHSLSSVRYQLNILPASTLTHWPRIVRSYTIVLVRDRRFDRIVSAANRRMPASGKYHQIACRRSASAGVGAVAADGWLA